MIAKGFAADSHCTAGALKESFVKITKAEPGATGGQRLWRPAQLGLCPGYESPAMLQFLRREFVQ